MPGIAFLVAGQVAWDRRPDNRIGPLMVAIGFAWYVGTYGASRDPFVGPVAHAFQGYYDALLAWLVLAYPTGRLRGRASRAVVGALLALLAARTVFRLATIHRSTDYDFADPAAVDRYIADLSLRDTGDFLFRIGIAVLAAAVLVLVLRRLRDETGVGRRVAGPILLGGIAIAVGVIVEAIALAAAGSFAERSVAWDLGQALTVTTATLVPIGFAYGLTQSRLARGSVADLVVELGDAPERPALRDVLARALRDPTLEVAYAVPESEPVGRCEWPRHRASVRRGPEPGDDSASRRRPNSCRPRPRPSPRRAARARPLGRRGRAPRARKRAACRGGPDPAR